MVSLCPRSLDGPACLTRGLHRPCQRPRPVAGAAHGRGAARQPARHAGGELEQSGECSLLRQASIWILCVCVVNVSVCLAERVVLSLFFAGFACRRCCPLLPQKVNGSNGECSALRGTNAQNECAEWGCLPVAFFFVAIVIPCRLPYQRDAARRGKRATLEANGSNCRAVSSLLDPGIENSPA